MLSQLTSSFTVILIKIYARFCICVCVLIKRQLDSKIYVEVQKTQKAKEILNNITIGFIFLNIKIYS